MSRRSRPWGLRGPAFPPARRFLIADDDARLRHGMRRVIEKRAGWVVCGEASNGREALDLARTLHPDVVILDVEIPGIDGVEATRRIARLSPRTRIILFTAHTSKETLRSAVAGGAQVVLMKAEVGSALVGAIENALADRPYPLPQIPGTVRAAAPPPSTMLAVPEPDPLTPREREVVRLVAAGRTSKEVAEILRISSKTATSHRANVMRKLGIHSVVELVHYAMRNRLIES